MTNNKGILIATITFIILSLADILSTLSIGPELLKYLETNPVYAIAGLPGLFALNIGVAGIAYFGYQITTRHVTRYSLLLCLIMVSFLRIFIVWNNIHVAMNPPSLVEAQAYTAAFKLNYYFYKVVLPLLMAYIPGVVAFMLFKKDHKITEVKK